VGEIKTATALTQNRETSMSSVKHVSKGSFAQDVVESQVPVLVDFYADWCGPCRMLTPTLQQLAAEFGDRVKIVKVNVDEEPELANQFQVESIPTLVFVANGTVVGRTAGLVPEAGLRRALHQLAEATFPTRHVG
jgi:thioredoxin 1